MSGLLRKIKGDKVIWLVVIFLSIFSLLAVYSSTGSLAYKYQSGNTEYYMIKHFLILLFGFAIIYFTHRIKYTNYSRIFQIALYIAIPLLLLTLIIGLSIHEAPRYIKLPFNLSFQTSDFAKLTFEFGGHEIRDLDKSFYDASYEHWEKNRHFEIDILEKVKEELS